jgi:hypothetical protein
MNNLVSPRQAIAAERIAAETHLNECRLALEIAQHGREDLGMHELEIESAEARVYRSKLAKVLVSVMYKGQRCAVLGIGGKYPNTVLTLSVSGVNVEVLSHELDTIGFAFEDFNAAPAVVPTVATEETAARFTPVSTPEELAVRSQVAAMELGAMLDNLGRTPQLEAVAAKLPNEETLFACAVALAKEYHAAGMQRGSVLGGKIAGKLRQDFPTLENWRAINIASGAQQTLPSARKPFSGHAGYIASKRSGGANGWVVIYDAAAQQLDTTAGKYVTVCERHGQTSYAPSLPKARVELKDPTIFCVYCRFELGEGPKPEGYDEVIAERANA